MTEDQTDSATTEDGSIDHGPRPFLAPELLDHVDELAHALVRADLFTDLDGAANAWLREQYLTIVPVVLPDAVRCIVTGERLNPTSHDCIGAAAAALRRGEIPFGAAVRGGVPAIRAFSAYIQTLDLRLSFCETALVMGRAALIAQELGACWVEVWREGERSVHVDGSTLQLASHGVGVDSDPSDTELQMITLTASGHSTDQIAAATKYSSQAVRWHLGRLMRAWKVSNRPALIAVAFVRGVLVATGRQPHGAQHQLLPPAEDPAAD